MRVHYVYEHGLGMFEGPFLSATVAQSVADARVDEFARSDEGQTGIAECPAYEVQAFDENITQAGCLDGYYAELGRQLYM